MLTLKADVSSWHHSQGKKITKKQIKIKSSHYLFILPWEWCHDDTETSAFNVNIRLLTIIFIAYLRYADIEQH